METQIFAVIIFILGLLLYFYIRKRQFNRRNVAGIETFSSYEKSIFIRLLELVGRILSFILIFLGIVLFWASYTQEKKREKIRQSYISPSALDNKDHIAIILSSRSDKKANPQSELTLMRTS